MSDHQLEQWEPPAHGTTGWDTSLIAQIEAARQAHNATDAELTVTMGSAVPGPSTPGFLYIQEVTS